MKIEQDPIHWKLNYNLNIEDIDFQHHFFANLINRLSQELYSSEQVEYQSALIAELNAYARFHFISEENMMFRVDYPNLEQHKQHHLALIEQLSNEGNMFRLHPSKEKAEKIVNFLVHWFLNHTLHEDKLFADYLHSNITNSRQGRDEEFNCSDS